MNLTYEYRLDPRPAEIPKLELLLEQSREVYNAALQQCKNVYQFSQHHETALSQWPYFREWRKQDGIILNASSLQQTLRRVDNSYADFFGRIQGGETAGQPRYKPASRFNSVRYTYGDGCKFTPGEGRRAVCYIQNVGQIKVRFHRPLPANADIKSLLVKRKVGKWYIYLTLELPDPIVPDFNKLPAVGGDMGLLRLLTLSDGTQIDNPRWLREALDDLRVAQRRLSRRVKGSRRRKKAAFQVARLHEHVARQRGDFWHKPTYWLVHTYGRIALEDLSLGFMTRNRHLSLSAHDAGLGALQELLVYKAANAGTRVAFVNPAHTSQRCSGCRRLVEKDLSERVHSCPNPECLLELDRDENAARNILALAFKSAWTRPSGANADPWVKRSLRSIQL